MQSENLLRKGLEKEECEDHDGGVSEVEEGRCRPFNVQLGNEVVQTVDEQIESRETGGEETAPPPMVVLQ